jgi:hypothetical protein
MDYISVCFSCNCRCYDIGRIRGRRLLIGWDMMNRHRYWPFCMSRENVVPPRCQLYHPYRRIHLLQTVEKDLAQYNPQKTFG